MLLANSESTACVEALLLTEFLRDSASITEVGLNCILSRGEWGPVSLTD